MWISIIDILLQVNFFAEIYLQLLTKFDEIDIMRWRLYSLLKVT
jgi:hypothetical protein